MLMMIHMGAGTGTLISVGCLGGLVAGALTLSRDTPWIIGGAVALFVTSLIIARLPTPGLHEALRLGMSGVIVGSGVAGIIALFRDPLLAGHFIATLVAGYQSWVQYEHARRWR